MASSRCPREAVVWTLILLSGLYVASAHSEPTPEDEIALATRLLETGRIEEAQTIVSRLRATPDPPLQVLFLSGALYSLTGHYREAAEEFRLMLARDPTLLRPRLELARALFMARQYKCGALSLRAGAGLPLTGGSQSERARLPDAHPRARSELRVFIRYRVRLEPEASNEQFHRPDRGSAVSVEPVSAGASGDRYFAYRPRQDAFTK